MGRSGRRPEMETEEIDGGGKRSGSRRPRVAPDRSKRVVSTALKEWDVVDTHFNSKVRSRL